MSWKYRWPIFIQTDVNYRLCKGRSVVVCYGDWHLAWPACFQSEKHRPTCCWLVHANVESKLLAASGVYPRIGRRWQIQRVSKSESWSIGRDCSACCCCSTSSADATKILLCAVLPQSTPWSCCSLSEELVTNRCVPRAINRLEHWMEYACESANKLTSTIACGLTPMLQQSRILGCGVVSRSCVRKVCWSTRLPPIRLIDVATTRCNRLQWLCPV